jgi:uncharacterized protein YkwD
VVCGTALAAGAGGVFSGVLPLPPGVPTSVVVAGDPASPHPVATTTVAPGPSGRQSTRPPSGTGDRSSTRPTLSPSATARASVFPSAAPSASGTATATPTATASASPSTSSSSTAAPGGTISAADVAADQSQILSLVNVQRAQNGCGPLTASGPLNTLAQDFSGEMATRGFFDHTDPDGKTPWDRAKALGITGLGGENIAMGQQTPQDVMTAWMNSPGHRANILNCGYHSLGVGAFATAGGGPWWTQDFGF